MLEKESNQFLKHINFLFINKMIICFIKKKYIFSWFVMCVSRLIWYLDSCNKLCIFFASNIISLILLSRFFYKIYNGDYFAICSCLLYICFDNSSNLLLLFFFHMYSFILYKRDIFIISFIVYTMWLTIKASSVYLVII